MAVSKSSQRLGVSVPGPLGGIEGSAVCFRYVGDGSSSDIQLNAVVLHEDWVYLVALA